MIIINNNFLIKRSSKVFAESILFTIGAYLLTEYDKDIKVYYVLNICLFFLLIQLICSLMMLHNYYLNMDKRFVDNGDFLLWKESFGSNQLRKIFFYVGSVYNAIIAFLFATSILGIESNTIIPWLVYLYATTLMKIFSLLLLGSMVLCYNPKRRENVVSIKEINEVNMEECSICLEGNESKWGELKCNHRFHFECIVNWTKINNTCPICRQPS